MLGARWLGFACRALRETSPFPPRAAESSAVVDATVASTGHRHRRRSTGHRHGRRRDCRLDRPPPPAPRPRPVPPPRAAESSAVVDATVAPTGQRHRPHLVQRLRVLPLLGAGSGFGPVPPKVPRSSTRPSPRPVTAIAPTSSSALACSRCSAPAQASDTARYM